MSGTPLPANGFDSKTVQFSAYARCKSLEERAHSLQRDGLSPLVCARILGYMLQYAPTDEGRDKVATEIMSYAGDSDLMALAQSYSNNFIRCLCVSIPCIYLPLTHTFFSKSNLAKVLLLHPANTPPVHHSKTREKCYAMC